MSVKIGKYEYKKSTRKDKKLMTVVDGKIIHFGDNSKGVQHFYDKTGILDKSLNHNDKNRRNKYIKRHSAILLKNGKKAIDDPSQPAYHSLRILW